MYFFGHHINPCSLLPEIVVGVFMYMISFTQDSIIIINMLTTDCIQSEILASSMHFIYSLAEIVLHDLKTIYFKT